MTRLVITAISDPLAQSTWSGTPRALAGALGRSGIEVIPVSGDDARWYDRPLYGSAVPFVGSGARAFRQYYGPVHGRIRKKMARLRAQHPGVPFLHTDHMYLPYPGMGQHDFLYRDTGWRPFAEAQGLGSRFVDHVAEGYSHALRSVGHTFTTSQWARDVLHAEGGSLDRMTVVGTGIGTHLSPSETPKDYANGKTLAVAKARFHNKGLDLLLDGFRIARESDRRLSLDLVVPPGVVQPQSGVIQHHQLSGEDLQKLYADASLFALPARYEPWGLVYLEAAMYSVPLLGSSRCAYPELAGFGSHGFVVEPLDAATIARALLDAHSRPDVLAGMGGRARSFAQEFTWDRVAAAIKEIVVSPGGSMP